MKRVLSLLLLLALLLAGCQKEQITTVCDYCGAAVSLSAKFCGECGQNLSMPTEQTTVPNTMGTTTAPLETVPTYTEQASTEPVTTEPAASVPSVTEPQTTTDPYNDSFEQLRELINAIVGRWYLEGYADVYIDVSEIYYDNTFGFCVYFRAENLCFYTPGVSNPHSFFINDCAIYPSRYQEVHPEGVGYTSGIMLRLEKWYEDLSARKLQVSDSLIFVDAYRFVRTQGTKNEQTEFGDVPSVTEPSITEPPITEPPVTEPPVTEPPVTEPPVTEPPVTEPPITEPPITEPPTDVLIISDTRTLSNQTIDTDVYITSTGVVTFTNVTVNGNVYCYGKLTVSGGSAHNLYAYYWDLGGITSSCKAWDGTHGLVKGAFRTCESVIIKDDALDYAFNKWGKR